MNRIREGRARWRNPFGGQEMETSLAPGDVAAIVFWSKNYLPLLRRLPELWERGYRFIFHFTITGLPQVFEPNVPPADEMVRVAHELARVYGPDAVIWRYDPILVSNLCPLNCHRRRFRTLISQLEGATRRCYFSFPTFYSKVIHNTARLEHEMGVRCEDIPLQDKIGFSAELAEIAADHGIELYSCCNDALVSGKVRRGSCVDAELLLRLYPEKMIPVRRRGTRRDCGCYESTDIGAYDTCPHGCVYCYANANKETALNAWRQHDDSVDSLHPRVEAQS